MGVLEIYHETCLVGVQVVQWRVQDLNLGGAELEGYKYF